jgi:hypothetical protein
LGRIRPELIANFLARCVFDRSLFCYTGWVEMFRPARGHRGGRVITAGRNSGTAGRDSAGSAEAAAGADESLQRADPRADAADGLVPAGCALTRNRSGRRKLCRWPGRWASWSLMVYEASSSPG